MCEPGEGPAQMAHGLGSSCMYCSVCCVCAYTNVQVTMRLQEVHGNDQDQPFIPWWDEGLVKGPERKGGGALGLLERLTVCWDTDGGPGRGGASVGTGLFRLGWHFFSWVVAPWAALTPGLAGVRLLPRRSAGLPAHQDLQPHCTWGPRKPGVGRVSGAGSHAYRLHGPRHPPTAPPPSPGANGGSSPV